MKYFAAQHTWLLSVRKKLNIPSCLLPFKLLCSSRYILTYVYRKSVLAAHVRTNIAKE
jgi:hypothetical protein